MKKDAAEKYLNNVWKELSHFLKQFLRSQQQEDLHQFRVRVKKLRSILTLYHKGSSPQNFQSRIKPLLKIYKKAGKIRDLYLQQLLYCKYGSSTEPIISKEKLQHLVQKFCKKKKKYLKQIYKCRREIVSKIHAIPFYQISIFFENELNFIILVFAKRDFSEQMHQCRKKIKYMLFNKKLVKENILYKLNFKYLDDLQHLIGEWHNLKTASALFEQRKDAAALAKLLMEKIKIQKNILQKSDHFWQKLMINHE